MYKRLALILLVLLMLLSGCSPSTRSMAPQPGAPAEAQRKADSGAANGFTTNPESDGAANQPIAAPAIDASGSAQAPVPDTRLVIRNANLTIVVDDPGAAMNAITRLAGTMGGYVVTSNLYKVSSGQGQEFPEANITVRVPSEKLNDALDQVKALVKDQNKDIQTETVSGQDVTKEYTDLQSQLTNLQNAEAQLREIMASATKTEDVLAVYNQLTQIRGQIEVIKGQIQYYKESAAMSLIAVQIKAQAAVQPLEIGGWKPVGDARNAAQALINTLQVLGTIGIWLILYVLPVCLLIFLPLRLLWWLLRRGRKNRKLETPAPPASA